MGYKMYHLPLCSAGVSVIQRKYIIKRKQKAENRFHSLIHISCRKVGYIIIMKKYKIGYTNGVFDLLHVGHLQFLKKAKSYCDYLIVAVCEDRLAFTHKGKFPVIPVEERMMLLEAIKYIDKVVIQTTTDRVLEWNKYHFDVIFHGIDGKEWDIKHGYFGKLKNLGVKSVYFERQTNISTSQIINKILEEYKP